MNTEYRVLVTGSRSTRNDAPVARTLTGYLDVYGGRLRVAAGGMTGVDTLAENCCKQLGIPFERYAVDHALDGGWPGAGPRRNRRMHDVFRPHEVAAMPGGPGTASMIGIARRAGTPVTQFKADGTKKAAGVAAGGQGLRSSAANT